MIMGICPLMAAQPPPPCPNTFGPWQNPVSTAGAGGSQLLGKDSFCMCPMGMGPVKAVASGTGGRLVKAAAASPVVPDIVLPEWQEGPLAGSHKAKAARAVPGTGDKGQQENMAAAGAGHEEKIPARDGSEAAALLCSYSPSKAKCRDCAYRAASASSQLPDKAGSQGSKAPSQILRENYLKALPELCQQADIRYRELWSQYQNTRWSYQAHHIISREDGYGAMPRLVRLGNFCGYDINNAYNCIMLPSFVRRPAGAARRTAAQASEEAYTTMKVAKLQWHAGPHDYGSSHGIQEGEESQEFARTDMELLAKLVRVYFKQEATQVYDYATLIMRELQELEAGLERHRKCWRHRKEAFIALMNGISCRIKDKLGAFQELPYKSYPYYVSQEAYMYAFNVPRSRRLVVADLNEGQPYFEKFRATRFVYAMEQEGKDAPAAGKDLRYELLYQEEGDERPNCASFSLEDRESQREFLAFIENIEYFVILSRAVQNKLSKVLALSYADSCSLEDMADMDGYGLDLTSEHRANGEVDYTRALYKYDSRILVWLRNHRLMNITAMARKCRWQRRQEGDEGR